MVGELRGGLSDLQGTGAWARGKENCRKFSDSPKCELSASAFQKFLVVYLLCTHSQPTYGSTLSEDPSRNVWDK